MESRFAFTKMTEDLRDMEPILAREVDSVDPVIETLAEMSKHEIRKWLRMKPSDLNRLTNKDIYNLLTRLLPEMEEAQKHLSELHSIWSALGDTAIQKRMDIFDNNILQFNEVLVAAITAPSVRYKEVVDTLMKRYPKIRASIKKIVKNKTELTTRLLKTTTDKLDSSQNRFPKGKPSVMKIKGDTVEEAVRVAGVLTFFQSLYTKARHLLTEVWEDLKAKAAHLFSEILGGVDELNGELEATAEDLRKLT